MIKVRTLRLRMIILFCAAVSALLICSYVSFFLFLAQQVRGEVERQLLETAGPIVEDVITDPRDQDISRLNLDGQYFELLDSEGHVLQLSKNLEGRTLAIDTQDLKITRPAFYLISGQRRQKLRTALVPFRAQNQAFVLAVAVPNSEVEGVFEAFSRIMALLLPVSLLLTVGLSIWYANRTLAPISALTRRARRITEVLKLDRNHQWTALPVERPDDELGHLAATFNQLFSQIDIALGQLRQFVTDASHELRTPLSVLRLETELTLSRPRTTAEYERTLHLIDAELVRLTRIVEGLFTISMAEAGQLHLLREPLYLNEVLEEACVLVTPRARSKSITIVREFKQDISYEGDEAFLRQLFLVFLDNAVKYSPPETAVRVYLQKQDGRVRVMFEDQGLGISDADMPHIFHRFFSAVPRSSGETHSGGLGLAIAQAIVCAHGGTIHCQSTIGRGSIFEVDLPLISIEAPGEGTPAEYTADS